MSPVPRGALRLPATACYWALLEAPGWRLTGPAPPGILADVEALLPLPIAETHIVCAPAGAGRVLCCAAPRSLLGGLDAAVESVRPDALPPGLDAPADPGLFELLTGEFEPARVRRARTRFHVTAASLLLLAAAWTSAGLHRRAQHWRGWADTAERRSAALLTSLALEDAGSVEAALARARSLHQAAAQVKPPSDAARPLGALLAAWPRDVPSRPLALTASDGSLGVEVALDGPVDAFLDALAIPEGLALDEPRLNAAGEITRLSLHLRSVSGGATP